MKNTKRSPSKEEKDVTIYDFFRFIDKVAEEAKTNKKFQKLIDSAAQRIEEDSNFVT